MHSRTTELLAYLDNQRSALRAAFFSVPPASRDRSPASGGWSAVGIIEHLAIVEERMADRLRDAIVQARAEGVGPEGENEPILPSLEEHLRRVVDRSTRIESTESVWPKGQSADTAWASLDKAGAAVRDALRNGDGLALGTRFLPHRVFGQMSLYYFFAFIGAHEARHAAQIRELVALPAEP